MCGHTIGMLQRCLRGAIVVAVTPSVCGDLAVPWYGQISVVERDLTVPCSRGTAKVFLNNRVRERSTGADLSPRLCFLYTTFSQIISLSARRELTAADLLRIFY
jgi:hypothetical protein